MISVHIWMVFFSCTSELRHGGRDKVGCVRNSRDRQVGVACAFPRLSVFIDARLHEPSFY